MLASDPFIQELRSKGVYFILPPADFHHLAICIAEGLEELGIPFFADTNNYRRPYDARGEWLFRRALRPPPADAALVVADIAAMDEGLDPKLFYEFFRSLKCRSAVLCMADKAADIINYFEASSEIPTFVAHDSKFIRLPGWRIPWAFGLNRDVLTKIEAALSKAPRRAPVFVCDFRPSIYQSVRQSLDFAFVKPLSRHFEIDRSMDGAGRFLSSHYERLAGALGCLAYGGTFVEDISKHARINASLRQAGVTIVPFDGDGPFIARWDSWRFWESLAAGCATVTLDFEEYGFQLPVYPKNGVHYIGLKLDRLTEAVEFMAADKDRLVEIGKAGRAWVLENYSPKAAALRFIDEMFRAYGGQNSI